MNELASATEVTQVITCVSDIVGEGQHTLDSVIVHISNAMEGIDERSVASRLRKGLTENTKGENNKVI